MNIPKLQSQFKICIIGAGVAGLYTAKHLIKNKIKIDLYDSTPFGKIITHFLDKSYLKNLKSTLFHKNINFFNKNIENLKDLKCDAFVVATGAEPRILNVKNGEYAICADKIIRWYNGSSENIKLGKKIGIIGFGDVTLDILKFFTNFEYYLKKNEIKDEVGNIKNEVKRIENITVFARSGPFNSSTSNSQLRDLSKTAFLNTNNIILKTILNSPFCFLKYFFNSKLKRKIEIYENSFEGGKPILINFNTKIRELVKLGDKIGVDTGKIDWFDTVISAIGYQKSNTVNLENANAPIFFVGAMHSTKGNVSTIYNDAKETAKNIIHYLNTKIIK